MRRVAVIADSHYDETKRFEECIRVHDWIAEDIERRQVDLIIHTGDLYERKSTPRERTAAAAWVQTCADLAPVLIVRGNHDAEGDLEVLGRLERRYPIIVEERAGAHVLGGVAVVAVAWPRKAQLLSLVGNVSHEESEAAVRQALENVFRGLGQLVRPHEGPKLLAMHAMVRNSVTSTGQPLIGCDMEIGLEELSLVRADFYALGHIHKGQDWQIDGAPVVYPGSPRRTAFGEYERKGYVIVEIEDSGEARWEFVETPCTRMEHLEATFVAGALCLVGDSWDPNVVCGAEVRFRYHVLPDDRDAARHEASGIRAQILAAGALSVKLEEVVQPKTRARAPELAAAKSLEEKIEAFWTTQGGDLPEERRERLLAKLAQIQEESAA